MVTGGSAGLGLQLAATLAQRGASVAINGRNQDALQQAAEPLIAAGQNVVTLAGDVTKTGFAQQLVNETIDSFGQIDFVCHAAGRSMRSELLATNTSDFDALWRINTRAAFELARAAADALAENQGHLVFIGSLASRVAPRYLGAYPSSKFPLAALAQQLRLERGPAGLHTLLVCPGPIARSTESGKDRYHAESAGVPSSAGKPGGGAKVNALQPEYICQQILKACEARKAELVLPRKAQLLFILNQMSPKLGDWLLRKMTS